MSPRFDSRTPKSPLCFPFCRSTAGSARKHASKHSRKRSRVSLVAVTATAVAAVAGVLAAASASGLFTQANQASRQQAFGGTAVMRMMATQVLGAADGIVPAGGHIGGLASTTTATYQAVKGHAASGPGAAAETAPAKEARPQVAHPQVAHAQVAHPQAAPARPAHPKASAMPASPYLIYDSVTPGTIPGRQRVATYVNGSYAASAGAVSGRGQVLWIDTNGSDTAASVLDVEPGDATPAGAAQWVHAKLGSQPHSVAIVYTMRSDWQQVKDNMATLPTWMQSRVRYWIADPTGVSHMVDGANATQWYWGTSYDITTANPGFEK